MSRSCGSNSRNNLNELKVEMVASIIYNKIKTFKFIPKGTKEQAINILREDICITHLLDMTFFCNSCLSNDASAHNAPYLATSFGESI